MAGPIAVMAAKRMPGKVIAVIGVDTLQNAEFKMPEEISKQVLDNFATDFDRMLRAAFLGMMRPNTDAELKNWISTKAEAQDQKMALGLMRDISNLDMKALLKDAGIPIRCINSNGGFQFFTPTSNEINRKYADYNAVIIDGVGHF